MAIAAAARSPRATCWGPSVQARGGLSLLGGCGYDEEQLGQKVVSLRLKNLVYNARVGFSSKRLNCIKSTIQHKMKKPCCEATNYCNGTPLRVDSRCLACRLGVVR